MADNSVIYKAGEEIGIYNLSKEGKLEITNIPMGCVELQEIKTLEGLILDDTKYEIRFEQKDNTTKVYTQTLEIKNETTCVEFSKVDITGDKELIGAGLEIKDENNNLIDSWTSTEETHKIEGLEVGKSYTLTESIVVDGYVKATDIKFTVLSTNEIQKVQMIDKIVEVSKLDIAGEEIEGSTLRVKDKNDKIVDEWISGKVPHKVNGLVEGETYWLDEFITADSYVKATTIEFTVTYEKETQKIEMVDKILEVSKVDIAGEEIVGATLRVKDKAGNIVDSWVSEATPHKVKGLVEGETYWLEEEIAADSYVKATTIEFTVTYEKETQKVEMVDKIVEVSKVDISGEEIIGATLRVLDKDDNVVDEWVTEKEPHKVKGLIEGEVYRLQESITVGAYVKASEIEFTVSYEKETQKIEMIDKIVLVSKIDSITGELVPDAHLKVVDEEDNVIDSWISTNEPHEVIGLEENKKYWLIEEKMPYGYLQAEKIEFVVTEDKQTQEIVMEDMPILRNIKVLKLDSDTNEIIKGKFIFGMYEDPECTKLIQEISSNPEEGTVEFKDVRCTTVYIKEIKAPSGYYLSDKVVKVELTETEVIADGNKLEGDNSIFTLNYYNKQIPKIQTGNEMNYLILLGSIIISLLGITTGIIILKRNKKNN